MENIRQGDILLKRINNIEGKLIGKGRRVLAYGEKTGHTHVLDGDVSYYDNGDGQILCSINGNAELAHQEHKSIEIPAGNYLVIRQRESDITEGIGEPDVPKKVIDNNNRLKMTGWHTVSD